MRDTTGSIFVPGIFIKDDANFDKSAIYLESTLK